MDNKKRKRVIISLYLAFGITLLSSVGYIGYKQYYAPKQADEKFEDIRDAYNKGELTFSVNDNNDTNQKEKDSNLQNMVNTEDTSIEPSDLTKDDEEETQVPEPKPSTDEDSDDYENHVIGWINIPGTVIDYPVLYLENDVVFYLKHDYKNRWDYYGSIYLDGRQSIGDQNMTVYGHNMNNLYHAMFLEITNYENLNFFSTHPSVHFDYGAGQDNSEWTVIGTLVINLDEDAYAFNKSKFNDQDHFVRWGKNLLEHCSIIREGATIEPYDQILTLTTCSYHYTNCRTVVICKKNKPQIPEEEFVEEDAENTNFQESDVTE